MHILNYLYDKLSYGVTDGKDDFHTMVFSNMQNNKVESRCVVLRDFDSDKRILVFNTDIRSPKVEAIRLNPKTHCLFYHFREKIQLRIEAYSTVHCDDSIHKDYWDKTSLSSRRCYLTKYNPSQTIEKMDDGIPEELNARIPSALESESGRVNFAVVVNKIISIDWLFLSSRGHQRALYDFNGEKIKKQWIAP